MTQTETDPTFPSATKAPRARDLAKQVGGSVSDILNLPLSALDLPTDTTFNSRVRDAAFYAGVEALSRSIDEVGVRKVMKGYQDGMRFVVTDGERRFLAAKISEVRTGRPIQVRFELELRGASQKDRIFTPLLDNGGVDGLAVPFRPIEVANQLFKATEFGWQPAEIAAKLGKSVGYVTAMLDFRAVPTALHAMVDAGQVSVTQVVQSFREHGDAAEVVLGKALGVAEKAGKTKVTARFVKGAGEKRVLRKAADDMYAALNAVLGTKSSTALDPAVLTQVKAVVEKIEAGLKALA